MTAVRSAPCTACPYRRDVPPGVWAADEYAKLPPYDKETYAQPTSGFACHATPGHFCHGWAVVGGLDLLALRLHASSGNEVEIPEPSVPLFASGADAAAHGLSAIEEPPPETIATIERLTRKHARLRLTRSGPPSARTRDRQRIPHQVQSGSPCPTRDNAFTATLFPAAASPATASPTNASDTPFMFSNGMPDTTVFTPQSECATASAVACPAMMMNATLMRVSTSGNSLSKNSTSKNTTNANNDAFPISMWITFSR